MDPTVRVKKWVITIDRLVNLEFQHLHSNSGETVFSSLPIVITHVLTLTVRWTRCQIVEGELNERINRSETMIYFFGKKNNIRVTSRQILELILGLFMASVPKHLSDSDGFQQYPYPNSLQHWGSICIDTIRIKYEVGHHYPFIMSLILLLRESVRDFVPTPWKVPGLIPRSVVKLL